MLRQNSCAVLALPSNRWSNYPRAAHILVTSSILEIDLHIQDEVLLAEEWTPLQDQFLTGYRCQYERSSSASSQQVEGCSAASLDNLTLRAKLTAGQLIRILPSFPKALGKCWEVEYALWFALVRIYGSLVHPHPVCAEGCANSLSRILFAGPRAGLPRVETRDVSLGHLDRTIEPSVERS